MSLNVSEIFQTVQGEGPNVGSLTTFIRFGLCNLRCPGWPCDTPYAVYPENRSEWAKKTVDEIVGEVEGASPKHICLTGGEPLLQKASELEVLARRLLHSGYTIDVFTNGTQPLPEWAKLQGVTVVMDFKLPSSGEYRKSVFVDELMTKDAVKFVLDPESEEDWEAFDSEYQAVKSRSSGPQVYLGVVWGCDTAKLVEEMLRRELKAKLNIQSHNYIFPEGTDGTSVRMNQSGVTQ